MDIVFMLVTHWSKNVLLRNLPDESKYAAWPATQRGGQLRHPLAFCAFIYNSLRRNTPTASLA